MKVWRKGESSKLNDKPIPSRSPSARSRSPTAHGSIQENMASNVAASAGPSASPPEDLPVSEAGDPRTPASGQQRPRRKRTTSGREDLPEQAGASAVTSPPVIARRCDCYHCQHPSWKRRCLGPGGTKADATRDYEARMQRQQKAKEYKAGQNVEAVAVAGLSHGSDAADCPGKDCIPKGSIADMLGVTTTSSL